MVVSLLQYLLIDILVITALALCVIAFGWSLSWVWKLLTGLF